jgi:hypothetical protein
MNKLARKQQSEVNHLNSVIHNQNLFIQHEDGQRERVVNAHISGGLVVVESLHTSAVIRIDGQRLVNGNGNDVQFSVAR